MVAAKKGERKRVGRPPKEPGERQRNRVTITLTDDEYRAVLAAAEGHLLGACLRSVVLRWAKGRNRR
jgi:hypothetical protein